MGDSGVRRRRGRARGRTVATGDDVLRWNFLRTLAALALAANLRDWRYHFCRQTSCLASSLAIRTIYAASCFRLLGFICYLICPFVGHSSSAERWSYKSLLRAAPIACDCARPMNLYCNIQTNSLRSLLLPHTRNKLNRSRAYINAKIPILYGFKLM